jgi:hypothetical protein
LLISAGDPVNVACEAKLNMRERISPSMPFITDKIVIRAATPTQTPSMDIQLINETKKPRFPVRT